MMVSTVHESKTIKGLHESIHKSCLENPGYPHVQVSHSCAYDHDRESMVYTAVVIFIT